MNAAPSTSNAHPTSNANTALGKHLNPMEAQVVPSEQANSAPALAPHAPALTRPVGEMRQRER